jgi:hypothetical protein
MDILLKQVRRPRTWQLDYRPRSSENRNSAFSVIDDDEVVIDDDEVASAMVQGALAASEIQARNQAKVKRAYDYIVDCAWRTLRSCRLLFRVLGPTQRHT